MTDLATVLSWFNVFDDTTLHPEVQTISLQLASPMTPEGRVDGLISTATALIPPTGNQDELAELFLHAGFAYARYQDWRSADMYIEKAIRILARKSHRQAIALWMAGWIAWELSPDGSDALNKWHSAVEIFAICQAAAVKSLRNDQAEWYIQRRLEMNATISSRSMGVYLWLAQVPNVELKVVEPGYYQMLQQLSRALGRQQTADAWGLIHQLELGSKSASDPAISPMLLMECGLGAERLGNLKVASEYYRLAVAKFPPEKHWQAVTRWMLGCVLWRVQGMQLQAQQEWVHAMNVFENLKVRADRANDQTLFQWYSDQLPVMKEALQAALRHGV
ncbi:MAG: hypothetical protein ABFD44_12375 [Anaerolineaceae bacterium]